MKHRKQSKIVLLVFGLCLSVLLTSVSADVISTSGSVVETAAPTSVDLNQYESTTEIRAFNEQQNVILPVDIGVNITSAGYYDDNGDLTEGIIAAGTLVQSHLVHLDPVGTELATLSGSVTFDHQILGVIIHTLKLKNSDSVLGALGTVYPTGSYDRGLELEEDALAISPDMRTLTIDLWRADTLTDQVRVITTPEPGTVLLFSLGGLVLRRRR